MNDSTLIDLERHRLLLETQVTQLRKALQTWQLWSAEYEGLKEEIEAIPKPSSEDLLQVGRDFHGEVVTLIEIDDILNLKETPRTAPQVIDILNKRLEYVAQNVKTAEKQLRAAEEKLEKVDMVEDDLSRGQLNEEGLPLTEITEQLDEEGNVLSFKTSTPGSQKGQLVDLLKQAGVSEKDMEEMSGKKIKDTTEKELSEAFEQAQRNAEKNKASASKRADVVLNQPREKEIETLPGITVKEKRKGVSFAEDIKNESDESQQTNQKELEFIMALAAAQNDPLPSTGEGAPVIPSGESEEDARMRSEMLAYGMSEIGSVVAELELESGSEWDEDDYTDDEITDDEDQYGRSTRKVVDEDIHKRMRELEEKLGVRGMINMGSTPSADISIEKTEPEAGIAQIKITQEAVDAQAKLAKEEELAAAKSDKKENKKKGVRFSEDLDISPAPDAQPLALPSRPKVTAPVVVPAPISDIVERKAPAAVAPPAAPAPKKMSRFKAARGAGPSPAFIPPTPVFTSARSDREVPTGPANATLASTVVERDSSPSSNVAEPDELDPALLQQEAATEYHKLRNKMIMKEGGFSKKPLGERVDKDGTILEEEQEYLVDADGQPKKLSRFMAARLGRG